MESLCITVFNWRETWALYLLKEQKISRAQHVETYINLLGGCSSNLPRYHTFYLLYNDIFSPLHTPGLLVGRSDYQASSIIFRDFEILSKIWFLWILDKQIGRSMCRWFWKFHWKHWTFPVKSTPWMAARFTDVLEHFTLIFFVWKNRNLFTNWHKMKSKYPRVDITQAGINRKVMFQLNLYRRTWLKYTFLSRIQSSYSSVRVLVVQVALWCWSGEESSGKENSCFLFSHGVSFYCNEYVRWNVKHDVGFENSTLLSFIASSYIFVSSINMFSPK